MIKVDNCKGHVTGGLVALATLLSVGMASAQEAAPAPAPAAPPAEPAPPPVDAAPAPAPAPPPEAVPPTVPVTPPVGEGQPTTPAPVPEAAPSAPEADPFKVTVGAGFRAGFRVFDPEDSKGISDQAFDELNGEVRLSGKVTDIVGWTLNLTVDGRTINQRDPENPGQVPVGGQPIAFQAQAMDVIGQLDFMDEFHVWMGRMLTASDRSNWSGSWFMMPWNYSGAFGGLYIGPRGTEEVGREVGFTVWGDIGGGKFKYYAAALDLDSNFGDASTAAQSPLYSFRLNYAAIGSEPGFYSSSTYYGGQDILAIGAAFQYQKDYSCSNPNASWNCLTDLTDDWTEFNADILAEFGVGPGTITGEAAYYHFSSDVIPVDDFFYILGGFTTKDAIGPGKLNFSLRFQDAMADGATFTIWEPSVAYLLKDYFAKIQLTYSNGKNSVDGQDDVTYDYWQLGFQIQQ